MTSMDECYKYFWWCTVRRHHVGNLRPAAGKQTARRIQGTLSFIASLCQISDI